jgi:hypothetical protein
VIARHPRARYGAGVLLIAALFVLGGCRVDTRVSVVDRGGGRGTVSVSAVLDAAALQALGGESGLARQLNTGDLVAAGWTVAAPSPAPGGGATVTASHGYSSPSQAEELLAEIAGSGPAGDRPFHLTVSSQRGFLHVHETLTGRVDLSCGLSCFGDPGLQSALGNPNGVATAPLLNGKPPSQVFGFTFSARLPGSLQSDNASARNRSDLTWTTPLGQVTEISAESERLNTPNVVLFSVLAGVVVAGGAALFIRRRRRKRKHARRRRLWPFAKRAEPQPAKSKETVKSGS